MQYSTNPWRYEEDNGNFVMNVPSPNNYEHYFHITDCRTSAQIIDHLVGLTGKVWGTHEVVSGFLRKVNEVLHLQSTMCGGGSEKGPINVERILHENATGHVRKIQLVEVME